MNAKADRIDQEASSIRDEYQLQGAVYEFDDIGEEGTLLSGVSTYETDLAD